MRNSVLFTLMLLFGSIRVFSQDIEPEWDYTYQYDHSGNFDARFFRQTYQMGDGSYILNASTCYLSGYGDFYGNYAGLIKLSPSGALVKEVRWPFPGYRSNMYYVKVTDDDQIYVTGSYTPDRDTTNQNYDPSVQDAFWFLYKLDENLEPISASYRSIRIDSIEKPQYVNFTPNEWNPGIRNLGVIFEDESIVCAYYKNVLHPQHQGNSIGYDSLFIFRMDYNGNLIAETGIETEVQGCNEYCGYNVVYKVDTCYVVWFIIMDTTPFTGAISFDNDMNFIKTRAVPLSAGNCSFPLRSNHNTTYVAYNRPRIPPNGGTVYDYPEIYEVEDNGIDDMEIIHRYQPENTTGNMDRVAFDAIDIVNDNELYFAYTLNIGFWADCDSWIVLQKLDEDFNIIRQVYYDDKAYFEASNLHARSIKTTKDGGLILCAESKNLADPKTLNSMVIKFPAEAFLGIEEAHNHGLKLAVAYPNPGHAALNIRTALQDAVVEVYDVQGRKVAEQAIGGLITTLDTESWPSGMYLWNVLQDGKVSESGKWVKE